MKTLALIGVGKWGKNILATLEKIPGANLKYLYSASQESLALCDNKYEKISRWEELLEKIDLEAVIIATPAKTHAKIATNFLRKGIAVFTEKPMVVSTSEAAALKAVTKKTGTPFMVGYQYIFNDHIQFIKSEIESGSFGKILTVISEQALIPRSADINVFWDAGSHPLSIFQYFFEPKKLLTTEGVITHDSAEVKIKLENAPSLEIIATCLGEIKIRKLTIVGEKATAVLDETLDKNKVAITKNGKTTYPEIPTQAPLQNELEHFLHCLETGKTPISNIDFGCQITDWLETISAKLK